MKKKRVLITGNSGYIGSHLTALLTDKYSLYGLDYNWPVNENIYHHYDDIRMLGHTRFAGDEFDAVVHLAALVNVGESVTDPMPYYDTNYNGTVNALTKIRTKNFILASTGAAEGCVSPYGVSKRAAEDATRFYCQDIKRPFTIFRFYNVIGSAGYAPTNPDGLMAALMAAPQSGAFTIFGNDYDCSPDGTCIRDYVHVMEICDAIETAIEKPSGKIECLGHGVGRTVKEMVDLFQQVNGTDFKVQYGNRRPGDLPSSVLKEVSPYMKSLFSLEQLLKV